MTCGRHAAAEEEDWTLVRVPIATGFKGGGSISVSAGRSWRRWHAAGATTTGPVRRGGRRAARALPRARGRRGGARPRTQPRFWSPPPDDGDRGARRRRRGWRWCALEVRRASAREPHADCASKPFHARPWHGGRPGARAEHRTGVMGYEAVAQLTLTPDVDGQELAAPRQTTSDASASTKRRRPLRATYQAVNCPAFTTTITRNSSSRSCR